MRLMTNEPRTVRDGARWLLIVAVDNNLSGSLNHGVVHIFAFLVESTTPLRKEVLCMPRKLTYDAWMKGSTMRFG